jgi:uncharacterized RDD family membrane protein YckC
MKCPKCGYLGFETSERCRNCGYDFSLAVDVGPPDDGLPLRSSAGPGAPLADFDLSPFDAGAPTEDHLDLDRLIGDPSPGAPGALGAQGASAPGAPGAGAPSASAPGTTRAARSPRAPAGPNAPGAPAPRRTPPHPAAPGAPGALPLFGGDDDTPLITSPRPLRPPLSVRRTTPEIPRVRPRPHQSSAKLEDGELTFHLDRDQSAAEPPPPTAAASSHGLAPASAAARLGAAVIDVVLLGVINLVVVYLTLALAGLSWQEYAVLPLAPLIAFLAILNGGYLAVFIAAAGQTIGKMVTGVRVIGDDGQRVSIAAAVMRTAGCAGSLLTLGLGYLPAFVATDRRALQDRIAGTRVVRAR